MGCRNTGSHTRSASSIRVSTCDTAPKIRAAIGRDKVFCVSSASNASGGEHRYSYDFLFMRMVHTSWILPAEDRRINTVNSQLRKFNVRPGRKALEVTLILVSRPLRSVSGFERNRDVATVVQSVTRSTMEMSLKYKR